MFVSVVVATYNRADRIGLCLEALYNQSCTDFEIIVSDDGSVDETVNVVAKAVSRNSIPTLFTSHHHNGWGLARTRNQGATLATGDMLVFIDSDILLNPDAVGNYARLYKDNPDRVIAGYYKYLKGMTITSQDIRINWQCVWDMTLPEIPFDQRFIPLGYDMREALGISGQMPRDLFDDESKIHPPMFSLLGGNMGIPKHIWEQTEGFDEGFTFYGGEDAEYSLQVAELGYGMTFSRSVGGGHMAHPKAFGEVREDDPVMPRLRQRHPRYFLADGSPAWAVPGFRWGPQ
jgi:glycosyltransferase involved in cell wall biosynthesis